MSQMPIVKMMETAPSAAREFLKVLAVFVTVVGLGSGLGFHGVGGFGEGIDRISRNSTNQQTDSTSHL
jgi:hypothetical protein